MSPAKSLSELNSKQEFLEITHASTGSSLSVAGLSAIWSTLSLLSSSNRTPDQLCVLPSHLALVVSSSTQNLDSIPPSTLEFVENLTRTAYVTCESLSCSSVLAGLSSESDEFGDVGILLPRLGEDRETQIVKLLGLEDWLQTGGRIVKYEESSHDLPSGLAQIPQALRASAGSQFNALTSLLSRLNQTFEFRLEGGEGKEGTVIWFFLGRLDSDKEQLWAGLVGAGSWGE